ncbi:MAG: P-loop NTPase [Aeromonas popoffii]|uniref:nucleotide-binding protein n=1 Tax=Aeromonas popoffii TaxID=70856 RepID=UPI003F36BD4B
MSKVICCLSQKGGVGKSTIARIAAVAYAAAGWSTIILDADASQETSNEWFTRRLDNPKAKTTDLWVSRAKGVNPVKKERASGNYDMIIVDGAPHATDASVMYAKQADLILIPTGTAIDDLEPAVRMAISLVSVHGIDRERIRFVLNHCSRNKRETSQAIEAILGSGLKVMGAMLNESPCYRSAMDAGLAPNEVPYFIPKNRATFVAESIANELEAQFCDGSMGVN